MSLSGPEALHSLDEALRDIRREEDEIAKRLARSGELVAKIRETETGLLRQLAAIRLDPATQEELSGRLSQAERRAREMFKQHAQELSAAEAELKTQDQAIAALVSERAKLAGKADKLQDELEALATRVAADTAKLPDYAKQRQAAEDLQQIADESLRKTTQAEADREQKGRPYRDDPLFMYLWENSYGTRNYRGNNLVRWLDGMVARLVGFHDARPNFAMLNEIPLRLREHAERQQQKAQAALEALADVERQAVDAAGGKPIRDNLEQVEGRIGEIDAEMVTLEDGRDDTASAHRELAQGRDPAFTAATEALAEGLEHEDTRQLLQQARATSTGQDDTIVKQIEDARSRVLDEESETREQRSRLQALADRRRELEDIQYEFKRSGFDNPRSTFREDNLVGDLLNEFLRGGITAAGYWDQWQRSQNWNHRDRDDDNRGSRGGFQWPDTSFGGGTQRGGFGGGWGRLPGGGGRSGGGGFSRPRTGSVGTRKHGGFKTGGGF